MVNLEKKFKIFINGISSPELLLWQPIFKDFLTRHKECICTFQTPLSESDSNYSRDHLGISDIDSIETIEDDTQEELILFFCLAHQIPTSFSAKDDQDARCFFGGMSSSNLSEQLESARKRKITTIYSDLLPCEVKDSLPLEEFLFFNKIQAFLPHGYDETTIKINSNSKTKVLFITDKAPKSKTNASTSKILLNVLSQKEDFQVVELSQTDLNQWIKNISPGENCQKIILSNIPIPLQHFVTDICRLRSIQLQHIFTESFPSPQRRYLNDNELFESLWDAVSSSYSVRKRVHDILDYGKAEPTTTPKNKDVSMLRYSSPEAMQENGAINPRKLFTDLDGKLESFRETEKAACDMAFGLADNSLQLQHPYSELNLGEEVNSLVIHTLVFLEASIRAKTKKGPYQISRTLIQRCILFCLSKGNNNSLPILLNLFVLERKSFTELMVELIANANDETERLFITNQMFTILVLYKLDLSINSGIHNIIHNSFGTALLQLFTCLDNNEFDLFLKLKETTKVGRSIIYPLTYFILTNPRSDGPSPDEIKKVFYDLLPDLNETILIARGSIYNKLTYQKETSLSEFNDYDQRHRHIFEKCPRSLFNFAYIAFINSNSLDKEILLNFQRPNESFYNILLISSCIMLEEKEMINELLTSLTKEDISKFLKQPIEPKIKLQSILIIQHFFEVNTNCSKIKDFLDSYDFRDNLIFKQRIKQLPKYKQSLDKELEKKLSSMVSPEITFHG
jgi:hypothetical protein